MCHIAFLATKNKIITKEWNEEGIFFISEFIQDKITIDIRLKMENQFIYKIGSFEGCACGFSYDEDLFDNLQDYPKIPDINYEEVERQNTLKIRSIEKLIELIKNTSMDFDVEFYSCWFDELNMPIKEKIELYISSIDIRKNYFGLIEKRKIIFKNNFVSSKDI